ncbi:MAG: AEC family transporter [Proteobacteria bacterium]|nr:AEC family transporter [Pseudomonadota bacterium]
MIDFFLNSFFPVAILIFVGFVAAKKSFFSYAESLAIIKYVGLIAVPAITLKMTLSINFSTINWLLISNYIISEVTIYLFAMIICKYLFKLNWSESVIIGMASSFANHLLFVYPMALNEYESNLINPIIAIIGFDVIFLVINLIILDCIKFQKLSLKTIFLKQFSNIPLLAFVIGLIIIFFEIKLPITISRSLVFVSESAAPCALFAAGIILSQRLEKTQIKISYLIVIFKVVLHPILAIILIWNLNKIDFSISETTIMVASAPVGLMALIFSTQYGVNPNPITRALLITTILSIVTIPLVGTLS